MIIPTLFYRLPALRSLWQRMPLISSILIFALVSIPLTLKQLQRHKDPIWGIYNTTGICYAAATKQMLDCVVHLLGEQANPLTTPGDDFVGAYVASRHNWRMLCHPRGSVIRCAEISPLVQKWVELHPEIYLAPCIIKSTTAPDGTVTHEELFPDKVGDGAGGVTTLFLQQMIDAASQRYEAWAVKNPFMLSVYSPHPSNETTLKTPYLWYLSSENKNEVAYNNQDFALLQDNTFHSPQIITVFPQILTVLFLGTQQHILPLYARLQDAQGTYCSYKLLTATYAVPHLQRGCAESHAIAWARYADRWYYCDNHITTLHDHESQIQKWMEKERATSYSGSHYTLSFTGTFPQGAIYEKVSSEDNHSSNLLHPW